METDTERKTFRNLSTRVAPDKRDDLIEKAAKKEIEDAAADRIWDEWEEFGKKTGRLFKLTIPMALIIFLSVSAFAIPARAWTLGGNYNASDPEFNVLAMRVYNSGAPYIVTMGAYTYNALPITSGASGCKIISIIRRTQGFTNPRYWAIENYRICGGNITDVENTNPAGWNNLPEGIKPVIRNAVQEARQYGKAAADYYGYRVVAGTGADMGSVYVYVLEGIKLEAAMRF